MKKRIRSVISLLLAILMLVGSTPLVHVHAADGGVDLTNGLLAHYDFENVTGTTVPNTAGDTYPAAISGSATVVDLEGIAQPGKALQLGSAAGGMQLTDIVNASASSFSVSLWYKATATSSNNVNLVQAGTMDGSTGRTILILAPNSTYYTYLTGDNAKVTTANAVSPTTWQHITLSYDQAAGKVYFFVNGVADRAEGLTLSGTALNTADMIIGRHRNANEGQFNGYIDEVRVYSKVLSAEEAAAIYDNTKDAYAVPPAAPVGDITLTVDPANVQRVIDSDSIFGINHRYAFNGYGSFDSETMQIKDDFLALYEDAGFGSIRYPGGTISNLFNWKTAIGPVEQRKNQIHGFYNNAGQGGIAPNFGLTEIGTFAEQVGSEMVYVYSLGRGNAQDAADLIEYLNAKVGTNPNGGIDWAAVRAANGHEEPYNVRYFEIGNEMQQAYGSGYDGTASQGYWTTYVAAGAETAYIDGGTATFDQQYAVCEEDWNATASLSDGTANMVRYMRYANVNPKKDSGGNIVDDPSFKAVNDGVSVWVGSTQWTVVDSFDHSGASDQHVVIDYSTGAIHFGDGIHGAIPAAGQQIHVSYSVDRDGFIAVSQAMRDTIAAINQAEGTQYEINIYSSYESQGFITKMADRNANDLYDGLTIHPYSGTPDGTGQTFYDSAMYKAEATGIAHVQNYINMMPADKVPVISEYGIFRSTDALVRSQTHAIYIAKVLMEYVRLGSPYIQKHCLIDWYSSGADSLGPTQQAVIQAVAGADANTKTGEGTFSFFSTPSAHVFKMLNSAFADNVIATEFSTTPTMSNGAKTLSALASKDASGTVYLAIVNASREADYELTLDLKNTDLEGAAVSAQVLTADSFDAQNSPDDPDNVTVSTENVAIDPEHFTYTVPKYTFVILTIDPAEPTEQVDVVAGETVTITDSTGNYQNAVVTDALDTSIAAVTVTGTTIPAEKTLAGEVTSIVSGGKYILYSDRGAKPMTNAAASVVAADGTMNGLSLSGAVTDMADNAIWTITETDGGYTVQDANGKYLSIAMNNVTLSDTRTTVSISYSGSYWTLGNGGAYLNDAGAVGTCASGYSSGTGFGSQWSIYAVSVTPASGSTRIDITGVSPGSTYVQVGPTGYQINVAEPEEFSAAFSDSYATVGKPMSVNVKGTGSNAVTYKWTVGGTYVSSDATYTPTSDDLMKWISVTVTCGSDTATLEMFFSKLPVLYINTENGAQIVSKEDYIDAQLTIQGNETYNTETSTLYNGATEIRGRGNSTWAQPKKPYKLKLDKKTDVFGMGKNKHWVLLANYLDESLLRNTLAYDLSGAMGMEQMSTVFVDVVLNGEFIGNYQFCEQIRVDSTRVDVFDWEGFAEDCAGVIADTEGFSKSESSDLEDYMLENMGWITSGSVNFNGVTYTISDYPDIEIPSINGGYLLELDEYYDEVSKFRTNNNQPIMFKNPEFVGTNSDMMNFVRNYVQAFEDAVCADSYTAAYEGETVHYSDLYDFDALVDYWLVNEIFFNEELNKKSTYMYKDIDGLMYMGPIWDMDWSSGGEGQTYRTEQWSTRYYNTNAQANNWYKYLIQDPYFFIRAQERYWEIRNAQVADMMTQIDTSYELLKESANANGSRWGYGSDYKKYVDDLRNWFNSHLTWLDTQMATQTSLQNSLGYSASSRLTLSLTDAAGNALDADTAEHAPADGIAANGQALKLVITGGDNTTGNAVLYINGRRTGATPITANSTITVEIPGDSLTAQAGEKNVLEVQIEVADGSVNASRYVTVSMTGQAHTHVFDQQKAEAAYLASEATCTAAATYYFSCACGEKGTETFSYGDAAGHDFGNGICTVCGTGIAVNETTGEHYATVADALSAAVEGDTVKMMGDAAEGYVLVYPGITLDLNGCVLTADYAVGFDTAHIVDKAGGGKLVIVDENLILDEQNAMLPVYDGTGYLFTRIGFAIEKDTAYTGMGIKINALAYTENMDIVELLKNGAADNHLQFMIVLSWDYDQGTGRQKFVFTDNVVASVYASNQGKWSSYGKRFTMVITGIENVENLTASIMLVSDTNVERSSAPTAVN